MTDILNRKDEEKFDHRDRNFLGLLLVGIGMLMLLFHLTGTEILGFLILPAIGAVFLAWGFYTHRFGLTIPGCILVGLGVGLLVQRVFNPGGSAAGGVLLLGLGAGFLGTILIAPFFEHTMVWWPAIPAAILAVIGGLLVIGGGALTVLQWLGAVWPVFIVTVGLYVLLAPHFQQN